MERPQLRPLKRLLVVALASLVGSACSESAPADSTPGGSGGTATGGSTASGGQGASAGVTASAGMAGTSIAAGGGGASAGSAGTLGGPGGAGTGATSGSAGASGGASGGNGGAAAGAGASPGGGASGDGGAASGGAGAGGGTSGAAGLGGAPAGGAGAGNQGGSGASAGAGGQQAGGRSGSAGSGGATFQACPGSPCKVMPLGDSITWGVGDEANGGYRGPLFSSAVTAGKSVTFTGSLMNGPTNVAGQMFPRRNQGHSGWGISRVTPYSNGNAGITTVIPNPGFSSGSGGVPDIILLHIGTNDQGSFTAEQMTSDLGAFLDKLITNAPNAYLVVAQIIPLGYGTNDKIRAYNQTIPGLVQERANAGKHIAMVDMYTGFMTATMLDADDIHPNAAGYRFMADRWYAAIGPLLPP